jgi:hypothetical protein
VDSVGRTVADASLALPVAAACKGRRAVREGPSGHNVRVMDESPLLGELGEEREIEARVSLAEAWRRGTRRFGR